MGEKRKRTWSMGSWEDDVNDEELVESTLDDVESSDEEFNEQSGGSSLVQGMILLRIKF